MNNNGNPFGGGGMKPAAQAPHFSAQPSYDMRDLMHVSGNPVHVEHLQKAFQMPNVKTAMSAPPAAPQPGAGSPWAQMIMGKIK